MPPLHDWDSFYVIIGSSAAALTGLQFVVVALMSDAQRLKGDEDTLHAFATPQIVQFGVVLLISAFATMPGHTAKTFGTCMTIGGVAGVMYQLNTILRTVRQTGYKPVLADWIWYSILPMVAYVILLIAGIIEFSRPAGALYPLAATSLLLLFVAIHNAWDTAVYIAARRGE